MLKYNRYKLSEVIHLMFYETPYQTERHDGEGVLDAVTCSTIETAISFLDLFGLPGDMTKPETITASPQGGIDLDWHEMNSKNHNHMLTIEFDNGNVIWSYMVFDHNKDREHEILYKNSGQEKFKGKIIDKLDKALHHFVGYAYE